VLRLELVLNFELNDILKIFGGQNVESEKYDRSFVILRLFLFFLILF